MVEMLFDTPWWLPTILVVAGILAFLSGNRRQDKQIMYGGLAVLLLGIAVALLSYFIDTAREKAVRRTRDLVAAANARDWNRFRSLLDPQTSVYGLRGPDVIAAVAGATAERYRLGQSRITGTEVDQTGTVITVSIRVLSDISGHPVVSDWQLQFQDFGQGWKLYDVRALSNDQIPEARIRNALTRER
jgi:hypothetical protein